MSKAKIINDPIHGFITIPAGLITDLLEHPWFQRLRRIRQLGITDFVYPGALHTRFHHAIGATHLMGLALSNLRGKGVEISSLEFEAAQAAILLHDIGHGPFSHALERTLLKTESHELISMIMMQRLCKEYGQTLQIALEMFTGIYSRPFFHQLISSQLDVDRLDYLKRDSFFTGVIEGEVGSSRILKMLDVVNEQLVIEEKGIYSVEAFLNARRIMYWQVYLHKTTISSEKMLDLLVNRVRELLALGEQLPLSAALETFLLNNYTQEEFENNPHLVDQYALLDDFDIWMGIKNWANYPDLILSTICKGLLNRNLFKIELGTQPISEEKFQSICTNLRSQFNIEGNNVNYLVVKGKVSNAAYLAKGKHINILKRNGEVINLAQASDLAHIEAMQKIVTKHYLCWYKPLYLQNFPI